MKAWSYGNMVRNPMWTGKIDGRLVWQVFQLVECIEAYILTCFVMLFKIFRFLYKL